MVDGLIFQISSAVTVKWTGW